MGRCDCGLGARSQGFRHGSALDASCETTHRPLIEGRPMRSLVLFSLAAAAFAQTTATITGNVLDLQGERVANAQIQATNVATKAVHKATSSDKGSYTFAQLPAGVYDLSVALLGVHPYDQKNVTVAAGQTLRLDIHLFDFQLGTLGDGPEFRRDQYTPHATPTGP